MHSEWLVHMLLPFWNCYNSGLCSVYADAEFYENHKYVIYRNVGIIIFLLVLLQGNIHTKIKSND